MKFVIDETKDKMIRSLVQGKKNVMITGATGAGKTSYCYMVGEDMGRNGTRKRENRNNTKMAPRERNRRQRPTRGMRY